jgi:flagellar M-ring protein FliF
MESNMLMDPSSRDHRLTRDLELRLEKTITQLSHVVGARVHLGIPEREVFARYQGEKTASITVALRPGNPLTRKVANAIINLVANSVEGLKRSSITLADTHGNTHSSDDSSLTGAVGSQLEYQRLLEDDLATKAESMLEQVLGDGNVVVRVTADIDFTKIKKTEKKYDPESKVTDSEETVSTTGNADDPLAVGVTGVAGNLGARATGTGGREVTLTNETRNVIFKNGHSIEIKTMQPGTVRRLTIAAMVQLNDKDSAEGAVEGSPGTPSIDRTQIEAIIKSAVGFDETRKDVIEVLEVASLTDTSLQMVETQEATSTLEATMATLAKKNPELLSSIIAAWTRQDQPADSPATSTSAKAAA